MFLVANDNLSYPEGTPLNYTWNLEFLFQLYSTWYTYKYKQLLSLYKNMAVLSSEFYTGVINLS